MGEQPIEVIDGKIKAIGSLEAWGIDQLVISPGQHSDFSKKVS